MRSWRASAMSHNAKSGTYSTAYPNVCNYLHMYAHICWCTFADARACISESRVDCDAAVACDRGLYAFQPLVAHSVPVVVQYTMYPQSLYENIVRGSALGVPIYVTEIGCADKSPDDHIRIANIDSSMNQACHPALVVGGFPIPEPELFDAHPKYDVQLDACNADM
jgi:hypothetical protein